MESVPQSTNQFVELGMCRLRVTFASMGKRDQLIRVFSLVFFSLILRKDARKMITSQEFNHGACCTRNFIAFRRARDSACMEHRL